ncbi:uncharacterized protein LOC106523409 [Austrofundulus limnaeus]|uniref:Uncharacterized protein LOC106523409 n=1 Tax=Austrofundulus limnaeus TaxID=52670 RepID=A0A2I4BWY5_AUSLI|nr:PREDICTED: uncharacterized protein LOC106523409 [Austrofundulus limnaeus]
MANLGFDDIDFWMQIALKREKGRAKAVLFSRKEDDDDCVYRAANRQEDTLRHAGDVASPSQLVPKIDTDRKENTAAQTEQSAAAAVSASLYPDLARLGTGPPPDYDLTAVGTPHRTRQFVKDAGKVFQWDKTLHGGVGRVVTESMVTTPDLTDTFPMIEVPNPNPVGVNDRTMLVFRTWTTDDIKKAVAGVTPVKEDVGRFVQDMEGLRLSYHLNGVEVQQVWMTALALDWHHVVADWSPNDNTGVPLAHNSQDLKRRVEELIDRTTKRFMRKANYTEIHKVKQGDDEPFEQYRVRMTKVFLTNSGLSESTDETGPFRQQLKNALHAGSRDAIKAWITKFYVHMGTGSLDQYIEQALHAEKAVAVKKRKEVTKDTFFHGSEHDEVFYQQDRWV